MPTNFLKISKKTIPLLGIMNIAILISGILIALFIAPTDYHQGETYRILYIHVPSAWMCIIIYLLMTILSITYLLKKYVLAFVFADSLSKVGLLFTFVALITGSLWGKPMWGTYWVWDARLTSVLLLFFIYLGYILISPKYINQSPNQLNIVSYFCIIGCINIPIVKYSVDWWNTLHQPASINQLGSSIHESMMYPLLLITLSMVIFTILITFIFSREFLINNRINNYLEKIIN